MFKIADFNDKECGIAGYEGKDKNVIIPEYIGGKKVVEISPFAFEGCSSLVSVTLPNSIEAIGNSAFYDCSSLTTINIPDSMLVICLFAFVNCSSLKSIIIPKSVYSVGTTVFLDCHKDLVIKCEAEAKPKDWAEDWNADNYKVIWGYVDENKKMAKPKVFKRLDISGDDLQIIVLNQNSGEEEVACKIDMAPLYWEPGHLEDNIFIGKKPNEEFLENFCCDISSQIEDAIDSLDIVLEGEVDCLHLFNVLLEEKFGV